MVFELPNAYPPISLGSVFRRTEARSGASEMLIPGSLLFLLRLIGINSGLVNALQCLPIGLDLGKICFDLVQSVIRVFAKFEQRRTCNI
jgi:hypothetical protein